jgi:hypothetical protein
VTSTGAGSGDGTGSAGGTERPPSG